jgi:GNAT superfamily N-acetyltransferase
MTTIRDATPADAGAICAMLDEFRDYLHALGNTTAIVSFGREEYLRDGFGPKRAFYTLIAESEGQPQGYAIYAFEYSTDTGRRNLFLHDLFVRSVFRGQGVGEKLMNRVADVCRHAGGTAVAWAVWHSNPAIEFYKRIGAKEISDVRFMYLEVDPPAGP